MAKQGAVGPAPPKKNKSRAQRQDPNQDSELKRVEVEEEAKGITTYHLETTYINPTLGASSRDRLSDADLEIVAKLHMLCQGIKERRMFEETFAVLTTAKETGTLLLGPNVSGIKGANHVHISELQESGRGTAARVINKLANKKFGSTVGKDLVDALVAILPDNRLCAAYSKALDGLKRGEEWAQNINVLNGAITVSELRAAGFDPEHPPALDFTPLPPPPVNAPPGDDDDSGQDQPPGPDDEQELWDSLKGIGDADDSILVPIVPDHAPAATGPALA